MSDPPAGEAAAPPPDFQPEKIREMIEAGVAPPAAWRPFIKEIYFDKRDWVKSLEPLRDLIFLEVLYFEWARRFVSSEFTDLAPIANLTALVRLVLPELRFTDISPLRSMVNLRQLHLGDTHVADISPLVAMTRLEWLDLSATRITRLDGVAPLSALRVLILSRAEVSDLSPLKKLSGLRELGLQETKITDVEPLANLTNLTVLDLRNTGVTDVTPLAGLSQLKELWLPDTVKDVSPLAGLKDLKLVVLGPQQDESALRAIEGLTVGRYADEELRIDGEWAFPRFWPP